MSTVRVVVEIELPDDVMDLLERLVTILERDYDARYGVENDDED